MTYDPLSDLLAEHYSAQVLSIGSVSDVVDKLKALFADPDQRDLAVERLRVLDEMNSMCNGDLQSRDYTGAVNRKALQAALGLGEQS